MNMSRKVIPLFAMLSLGLSSLTFAATPYPHFQPTSFSAIKKVLPPVNLSPADFSKYALQNSYTQAIVVSADGKTAYISEPVGYQNLLVQVFNLQTNTSTAVIKLDETYSGQLPYYPNLILSPDQTKLYVSEATTGEVVVINTSTNTVSSTIQVVPAGQLTVNNSMIMAVSPDGSKLYVSVPATSSTQAEIVVVDLANQTIINKITMTDTGACNGMKITPDGKSLYISYNDWENSYLYVMDLSNYSIIKTIDTKTNGDPNPYTSTWPALVMSHSGKAVYVMLENCADSNCSYSNLGILTIDVSTNTIVNTSLGLTQGWSVPDEIISPDDQFLYLISNRNYSNNNYPVLLQDNLQTSQTATVPMDPSMVFGDNISISPQGNTAYVTGITSSKASNPAYLWPVATQSLLSKK